MIKDIMLEFLSFDSQFFDRHRSNRIQFFNRPSPRPSRSFRRFDLHEMNREMKKLFDTHIMNFFRFLCFNTIISKE